MVPTSEDVDSELSRPRLFFPGGLLLVLKESLLPAEEGNQRKRSGAKVKASSYRLAEAPTPGLGGIIPTLGRQAIGARDRAVGGRQDGRQGREGHRELHVENLQPLLLGCQAQNLLLKPLVFLLQSMQRLQHLHYCREKAELQSPACLGRRGEN